MGQTKYAYQIDYSNGETDAQAIGEFLEDLIASNKEHVTSEEILKGAKPKESAAHDWFNWNDPEAAHLWRTHQAKKLVRTLVTQKDGKPTKTRALEYVYHPHHPGKKVLMPVRGLMATAWGKEQLTEKGVRNLQRSLNYWSHAYGDNPTLRALAKDVAKLRKRVERELLQAI